MQKREAGVSGYLVNAALESEEANRKEFQPDPAGCSLQNLKVSDSGTSLGMRPPPGARKSPLKAGAIHL